MSRRRASGAGLVSAIALLAVCLFGAPASAHTDLISVAPADQARLDQVPRALILEFSEEMNPGLSTATLRVDGGAPRTLDLANGRALSTLVATVPATMDAAPDAVSQWRVAFRVVSADGHPVAGESTFTVRATGAPSESPVPSEAATDDAVEEAGPEPSGDDREGGISWTLVGLPVAVLALLFLAVLAATRLLKSDQDA